ncbi:MAG TPA: hypothetical protein VGQ46_09100 [Thermoanaerobaculia bacterium]|jgi:hypothetical protein|nr:hypothetical protein [Thermoanaerobaculia bacterium]
MSIISARSEETSITIQQLNDDLPIVGGTLTLTPSSVDGLLASILTTIGGAITITAATKSVQANAVIIDGTASLLNVAGTPIHAVFTLDNSGTVSAVITWSLPATWTFATSFQSLPLGGDAPPSSLLGQLQLTNSRYVVATVAGTESASSAPLAAGLNFVSTITPSGIFGMFEALLGGKGPFTIAGPILLPNPTVVTPPLPPLMLPWQVTTPVPGIELEVPLGIDLSLGALHLHDLALRLYSPTDTTWLAANTTWQPVLAVTGTIDVTSAGVTGAVTALLEPGDGAILLNCDFSGATIGKLAQLSDLVNGPDLESILPPAISSALGSIALESAAIGLTGSLTAASVGFVSLQIGVPNVTWTLLSSPVTIAVGNLDARFIVASPFGSDRSLSVTFGGEVGLAGVTFDVRTEYPGFATYLSLDRDTSVPLGKIFSTLVPVLPAPPDLSVDMLDLAVTPGEGYSFSARMADEPAWILDVGPASMTVGAVAVDVQGASGAGASGSFSGTLEFGGGIELALRYDTPGTFAIRADFPDVKLSQLIALLNQIDIPIPTGFDLDLGQAFALIQEQGSSLTFSAADIIDNAGVLAFTAQKTSAWGFAAGLQLGSVGLSSIPGFGALSAIEDLVGLEQILIIVSSIEQTGFEFPDMAQFQAPPLLGHSIAIPSQAGGVVQGVNVYAGLSAAKNAGLKLLADFLGISLNGSVGVAISVSAPDPDTSSRLFFTVGTNINGSTRLDGEMGVLLQNSLTSVFLTGTVKTSIQGQPVTFQITAAAFPTGVLISGTMQGTITFGPVTLNNVAIEIGIDEAGIPSIGFAATIDLVNFESSIAVFFDSANPSESMFAGAVSDVSLLSIATAIAGQGSVPSPLDEALAQFGLKGIGAFTMPATVIPSLDQRDLGAIRTAFAQSSVTLPADDQIFFVVNTAGSVWHLTNLATMLHYELSASGGSVNVALEPQIYCAPQATKIGTLSYPQGIHVIAEVDQFLIKTRMQVEISPSQGIAADVSLAPIQLVSPSFFSITGSGPNGGPQLSLSTYTQSTQTDPRLQPPHFLLSGAMNILGVAGESIYVTVGADGLTFDFNETAGPMQLALNGSVSTALALAVGGSATIGINEGFEASFAGIDLGHIGVDVSVSASLSISASASGATATVQGSFDFEGLSLSIPAITLDVNGSALAQLPDTIWSAVQDAISKLLSDATQWLNWIKNGVITGAVTAADKVGNVLSKAYGLAASAIIDQTKQILGYSLDQVTTALKGAGVAAEDAANDLVAAGYAVGDVATSIAGIFTGATHIDFGLGHIDTPSGPHVDTNVPPHVDASPVHSDINAQHFDENLGLFHADRDVTPHVDMSITPHVDVTGPHADTQIPPHIDTAGPHIDT